MEVYYINLEQATDRRAAFVKSFTDSQFSAGWQLNRFDAISGRSDLVQQTAGAISDNLKGAHLSHLACVRRSRDHDRHALIAEDDTRFCHATEYWVDMILDRIPENSWDVILTDFYVPNVVDMPNLLKMRRECMARNSVNLVNAALWETAFAGSGSYIVNRRSKDKFLDAMNFTRLDHAYDLLLRLVMRNRTLNGVLTFPFLTTIAEEGDTSSNQGDDRVSEMILTHLFRRLVWIGAEDPARLRRQAAMVVAQPLDEDVATLGAIMTPLLSLQMGWRT